MFSSFFAGKTNGESQRKSIEANTGISASRVTEQWRINTSANYKWDFTQYYIEDDTIRSDRRNGGVHLTLVKSLGDHFSAGLFTSLTTSSFDNLKLHYAFFPAFEYNIFPYSESTRRQLRLVYGMGTSYRDYYETTIYDKEQELLFNQVIWANYRLIQKWGSINIHVKKSSDRWIRS